MATGSNIFFSIQRAIILRKDSNRAANDSNPTKALEYMATGRPIVSSAIEDVVLQFADFTSVASSHEEFIALCRRALLNPNSERIRRGIELARKNSWEAIVEKLDNHINEVLEAKQWMGKSNAA